MRAIATFLGLGVAAWLALPRAGLADDPKPKAEPVFTYRYQTTTLDNGLQLISVPFDSPGIIAYYTVVRTGSRNEVEKGLSGFAHFFEHMMFRGTKKYPATAYNDELKALGADSNAFTTDDWTCYHMTIPASALAKAVELESDRFQNLEYDEPAFQKEARAVLGEYNKSASSPMLKLDETMQATAFTTHTYRHTTIGFLEDVKDMPNQYKYSKTFFDRWYRPENCAVVVAGDVKHDELVKLAKAAYGPWKRGTARIDIPEEPKQDAERSAKLTWPLPTLPIAYIGYHIPGGGDPSDKDVAAMTVLGEAIFGEISPLYRKLVLKDQKVVTLMAGNDLRRDPSLFTIMARIRSAEDVASVRDQIDKSLDETINGTFIPSYVDKIKSHLRYAFAGKLDSPDSVARTVCEAIALTGRPDGMNDAYAAIDAITPKDLKETAKKIFNASNRTVISLESEKEKAR